MESTSSQRFDGLICQIFSELVGKIPQKLIVKFVDFKKRELEIDGVDAMNGFVALRSEADCTAFAFKLDYSLILNQANKSKRFHNFCIALPQLN